MSRWILLAALGFLTPACKESKDYWRVQKADGTSICIELRGWFPSLTSYGGLEFPRRALFAPGTWIAAGPDNTCRKGEE